jgi:hypothetical protein
MTLLAYLLLALNPVPLEPLEDRVDVIELNHCFDENGNLRWDQIIFHDCQHREAVIESGFLDTTTKFTPTYIQFRDDWIRVMRPKTEYVATPHKATSGLQVVAWRMANRVNQYPSRDRNGGYVLLWQDEGRLRRVRAGSFDETWTMHDPETDNKKFTPFAERRGLRGEKPTPPFVREQPAEGP